MVLGMPVAHRVVALCVVVVVKRSRDALDKKRGAVGGGLKHPSALALLRAVFRVGAAEGRGRQSCPGRPGLEDPAVVAALGGLLIELAPGLCRLEIGERERKQKSEFFPLASSEKINPKKTKK